MAITAEKARSYLLNINLAQARIMLKVSGATLDDLTTKALYLGHLCARGDIEQVKAFIRETEPGELKQILNCAPEQSNSTCLHMVLNWNTGDVAYQLFELLVEHGAKYSQDQFGSYPWQKLDYLWIAPIEHIPLGVRDEAEFEETRTKIIQMYNLENYQDEDEDGKTKTKWNEYVATHAAAIDVSM